MAMVAVAAVAAAEAAEAMMVAKAAVVVVMVMVEKSAETKEVGRVAAGLEVKWWERASVETEVAATAATGRDRQLDRARGRRRVHSDEVPLALEGEGSACSALVAPLRRRQRAQILQFREKHARFICALLQQPTGCQPAV
eukprot:2582511-Pleurochrysis_carterae.AAC.2